MPTTAATFCATLADEWVRAGVTEAFVAPGSRSTPLALALHRDDRLRVHLFHDERSAGFAALGHATATGTPTIVTCTSGTAAAHFLAPVIEADLSSIPLIVATTDRPPELWHVGAPQTVAQQGLFGEAVRFHAEPGVPTEEMSSSWRSLASRAVAEARGWHGRPGPVHLNLSFRDPLVGDAGPLPPARPGPAPWHAGATPPGGSHVAVTDQVLAEVWARIRGLSGVIVAGRETEDPPSVVALGRKLGWPILADHRSGCRAEGQAIAHFDGLLRSKRFADDATPDVILRFGQPLASKVLGRWIAASGADVISAAANGRWRDPERLADLVVPDRGLARGLIRAVPDDYRPSSAAESWTRADARAANVIDEILAEADGPTEPDIARRVVASIPTGGSLVVASSMPIRDVEWFGPNRRDIRVVANRGANGIDGTIATAIGVALTGSPTTLLIGDVAFLHDSTSLVAVGQRSVDLTIVIVDNDGGGIFSFLPQAEELPDRTFEELFGTPHGTDLASLLAAHGLDVEDWADDLPVFDGEAPGVRAVVATTDRNANVDLHRRINNAVIKEVEQH